MSNTVTLSLSEIESLATLHHATPPAKSDRDATPILAAVQLTIAADRLTALATDRYMVAELTIPLTVDHAVTGEPFTLQINSADLVELAKRVKRATGVRRDIPCAEFTITDDSYTINVYGQNLGEFRPAAGNFPPVARFFDVDKILSDSPNVSLDPAKLARVGKVLTPHETGMKPAERASLSLTLEFTVQNDRPGPMLITRATKATEHGFRALLQPVNVFR